LFTTSRSASSCTTSSSGTRRLWDPEDFSPPLSFAESLAASGISVGVKMGPGMPHDSVPAACEAQWVSDNGDVTEVALWFNAVRRPGVRRSALLLGPNGAAEITSTEDFDGGPKAPVGRPAGYLYEPDGAVIRAGLVADVALQLDGHLLDEHIAYICSAQLRDTPFARAYRILDVMPYNVKALKSWVKENDIAVLDIKKRGMSVTPEELRKQLLPRGKTGGKTGGKAGGKNGGKSKGKTSATLVLTRIGEDRVAIAVEPV
jgi:hypothetical protein